MAHRFKPDGGLARGDKPHGNNYGDVGRFRQLSRTIDVIKKCNGRPKAAVVAKHRMFQV
jgi:hypothetical protein